MIVTVTANPSLDRTVQLAAPLEVGEVQQAEGIREDAGGKGVNVARVLHAAGDAVRGVLPLAASDPYAAAVRGLAPVVGVPVRGHARANITITDPAGETTKINLPGAALAPDERAALIDAIVQIVASERPAWLALCGSVPPGAGDDFYVDVIGAVRERVAEPPLIVVDTSGSALVRTVQGARVDLIKPNELELAELAGRELAAGADLVDQVVDMASTLVPDRVAAALVTLGGDGAVLVAEGGAWRADIPAGIAVRSTVGAGDSALAGYLHACVNGSDPAAALEGAVRFGSATASLPGTQLATPADLPAGEIAVRPIRSHH